MKIMSVFGTRPEAIKMCPLVKELEKNQNIDSVVCLTGQHREMLQQVIDIFEINVKYNLDIIQPRQTLTTITTSVLEKMEAVLKDEKPDIVLVHGDTTVSDWNFKDRKESGRGERAHYRRSHTAAVFLKYVPE